MTIPSSITDLQATESLNSPQGGDQVGGNIDNYFRAHASIIKRQFEKGVSINSAATLPVPADGAFFNVTKLVSAITGFSDNFNGRIVYLKFDGEITLTHSAGLALPNGLSIVTINGDIGHFINEAPGVWTCLEYVSSAGRLGTARAIKDGQTDYATAALLSLAGSGTAGDAIVAIITNNDKGIALRNVRGTPGLRVESGLEGTLTPVTAADGTAAGHLVTKAQLDTKQPTGNYQPALGYTPVNKAGDSFLGTLEFPVTPGQNYSRQIALGEGGGRVLIYQSVTDGVDYFFTVSDTNGSPLMQVGVNGPTRFTRRPLFAGATPWDAGNFNPANKANAGAQVQRQASVVEFGSVTVGSIGFAYDSVIDLPAPYAMTGIRSYNNNAASGLLYPRGCTFINQ